MAFVPADREQVCVRIFVHQRPWFLYPAETVLYRADTVLDQPDQRGLRLAPEPLPVEGVAAPPLSDRSRSRSCGGRCGGDVSCVARVVRGLKYGVPKLRTQSAEVGIAQLGFQTVEACTELVDDRVGGTVQRRGCLRVSGATGYQCQAEMGGGDHQLVAVALRDGQRLIEHRPGIRVGVVEV